MCVKSEQEVTNVVSHVKTLVPPHPHPHPHNPLSGAMFNLTTLWANSADDNLMIFFLKKNRIWLFMQIVSWEDNLHEMSKI